MSGARNAMMRGRGGAPLVASVSPASVSASSATNQTMNTDSATASIVSGGTAPFSYSWAVINIVGMLSCTPNAPSAATTSFLCTGVEGEGKTALARCTITETSSGRQITVDCPINADFTGTPA